jgi:hypothetical protein
LRSDDDPIPGGKIRLFGDLEAIDGHPVSTLVVLDRDPIVTDDQDRMPARHQRIVERQLASCAPSDDERPLGQLEIMVQVAQAEAH